MKVSKHELRDWFIITAIILIGFLCLILAGSMAIRFAPSWQLAANMESNIDPNSDFLTNRPSGFIEPVDASILTPPAWINFFQTPGATVPVRTPLPTRTPAPTFTSVPGTHPPTSTLIPTSTNTIVYFPASPTRTQQPADTDTPTPNPLPTDADLQITNDDGVGMYEAAATLSYTITIVNNGPADAIGANINDAIPAQIVNWTWDCTAQNGGATGCDAVVNSTADFNDIVNLPNGASIEYTVTANISPTASGDLINSATISPPLGIMDLVSGNNSDIDTDQLIVTTTFPNGNIGSKKDGATDVITPGTSMIFTFNTPLVVNGHAGYDLIYYELANGAGIQLDLVILEISDGTNWYPIFNWGDGSADTNSNMNIAVLGGIENDNRDFTTPPASDVLYNSTGIVIELDGYVPPGTYPYIRLTSPATGDIDGGCEVDAIVTIP